MTGKGHDWQPDGHDLHRQDGHEGGEKFREHQSHGNWDEFQHGWDGEKEGMEEEECKEEEEEENECKEEGENEKRQWVRD